MSLAARLCTASISFFCVLVRDSHDPEEYSSTGRTICLQAAHLILSGIDGNIPPNKTECTVFFVSDVINVVFPGCGCGTRKVTAASSDSALLTATLCTLSVRKASKGDFKIY